MKSSLHLIAVVCILCVVGCARHKDYFTPPSSVEVNRNVARIGEYVRPEGKAAYLDLQKSISDYQAQVERQTKELSKAQEEALYWHEKQKKALKELWFWRGILLVSVACVVGYIGIKTAWRFAL